MRCRHLCTLERIRHIVCKCKEYSCLSHDTFLLIVMSKKKQARKNLENLERIRILDDDVVVLDSVDKDVSHVREQQGLVATDKSISTGFANAYTLTDDAQSSRVDVLEDFIACCGRRNRNVRPVHTCVV